MYLVQPSFLVKQIAPKAIWRKDQDSKKIYLTFDDGPIPTITKMVLEVLQEHQIKATFFCVGDNIRKHPQIYEEIIRENHAVGNHTFNHLNGWKTDSKAYLENILLCEEAMKQGDRFQPKSLFRPPYGKIKKSQLARIVKNSSPEYSVIMWDVLSGDYDSKTSPQKCLANVTNYVRNGSIIVFHDNLKAKVNLEYALPRFIEYALNKGFEFEKLA